MKPATDQAKEEYCRARGIGPEQHCCLDMAYAISHPVDVEHQGPNRVLDWIASWNEYLIPVAYDGYAATQIRFCPFCSRELPRSLKSEWYEALYALGYTDPSEQDIPSEYDSDAWWRNCVR
jgi:hypothetical protein